MLIVKIMADINRRDDDPRAEHTLLTDVQNVDFRRCEEHPGFNHKIEIDFKNGDNITRLLAGNVYIMNEAGKTISSFHPGR